MYIRFDPARMSSFLVFPIFFVVLLDHEKTLIQNTVLFYNWLQRAKRFEAISVQVLAFCEKNCLNLTIPGIAVLGVPRECPLVHDGLPPSGVAQSKNFRNPSSRSRATAPRWMSSKSVCNVFRHPPLPHLFSLVFLQIWPTESLSKSTNTKQKSFPNVHSKAGYEFSGF